MRLGMREIGATIITLMQAHLAGSSFSLMGARCVLCSRRPPQSSLEPALFQSVAHSITSILNVYPPGPPSNKVLAVIRDFATMSVEQPRFCRASPMILRDLIYLVT